MAGYSAVKPVLETFDGVENLSTEQRDGIANFIRSNDVLAVLPTGFGKSLAYTTSTVRDICTFAVLCWVNRPFCRFTSVYEGDFMLWRNFKQSISGYLHVASLSLILFWLISIASFLQLSDRACVPRARFIGLFLL